MNEQQRAALENALKLIDVLNVHAESLNEYDRSRMDRDISSRGLDSTRDQIIAALNA
jgi:hypothetical protein